MVEISDLSIIFAGATVCVAAIYYIFNIRYSMKAREIKTCRFMIQFFTTEIGLKSFAVFLRQLEWTGWDLYLNGFESPYKMIV